MTTAPARSSLLRRRETLTETLSNGPLNPEVILGRAEAYQELGYPDLAVADAYYALTLVETAIDPDFSDLRPQCTDGGEVQDWPLVEEEIPKTLVLALEILVDGLTRLGCLKQALLYLLQLREHMSAVGDQIQQESVEKLAQAIIQRYSKLRPNATPVETLAGLEKHRKDLPTSGLAPREIYPWNNLEPDRTSLESLRLINAELNSSAPHLEARATTLPVLLQSTKDHSASTCLQLGLFAKTDLPPSQPILHERSIITAILPIDAPLCDLCASLLPPLSSPNPPSPAQAAAPRSSAPQLASPLPKSHTTHPLLRQLRHPRHHRARPLLPRSRLRPLLPPRLPHNRPIHHTIHAPALPLLNTLPPRRIHAPYRHAHPPLHLHAQHPLPLPPLYHLNALLPLADTLLRPLAAELRPLGHPDVVRQVPGRRVRAPEYMGREAGGRGRASPVVSGESFVCAECGVGVGGGAGDRVYGEREAGLAAGAGAWE